MFNQQILNLAKTTKAPTELEKVVNFLYENLKNVRSRVGTPYVVDFTETCVFIHCDNSTEKACLSDFNKKKAVWDKQGKQGKEPVLEKPKYVLNTMIHVPTMQLVYGPFSPFSNLSVWGNFCVEFYFQVDKWNVLEKFCEDVKKMEDVNEKAKLVDRLVNGCKHTCSPGVSLNGAIDEVVNVCKERLAVAMENGDSAGYDVKALTRNMDYESIKQNEENRFFRLLRAQILGFSRIALWKESLALGVTKVIEMSKHEDVGEYGVKLDINAISKDDLLVISKYWGKPASTEGYPSEETMAGKFLSSLATFHEKFAEQEKEIDEHGVVAFLKKCNTQKFARGEFRGFYINGIVSHLAIKVLRTKDVFSDKKFDGLEEELEKVSYGAQFGLDWVFDHTAPCTPDEDEESQSPKRARIGSV